MDIFYDIVKVVAPIATIIVSYLMFHNKEIFERNKSDHDRISEFIKNIDTLEGGKEYEKDIAVASINMLKGFTFNEAKIILDKNLSRKDISDIRDVKVEGLCIFSDKEIHLCDKKQLLMILIKDFPLILLVVLLILFVSIILFSVDFGVNKIAVVIYVFFIEILLVFKIKGYISYFSIVKDKDRLGKQGVIVNANKFKNLKSEPNKISTDCRKNEK